MIIADFLARLDGVKQTRRGWMAKCPGHQDKSPSLSIATGETGNVLARCFAGCTAEEITAAMGLTVRDLFVDSDRSQDEIRRDRQRREQRRAVVDRRLKEEGARLDVLRQAENFIRKSKDIPDSHKWSDEKRDKMMDRLAIAYALLEKEARSDGNQSRP